MRASSPATPAKSSARKSVAARPAAADSTRSASRSLQRGTVRASIVAGSTKSPGAILDGAKRRPAGLGARMGPSNPAALGGSSSGRTTDSDSVYLGSNPSPPANTREARQPAGLVVLATGLG